jgi:putative FmdB family regulatory protein
VPTYAYRCADCGHRFETVQSFTDEALTVCPVCNGVLRKVFNAVGVVFKGSGFYRTDSRAAALAANGKGDAKAATEAKGSGDSGSGDSGSGDKGTSASSTTASGSKDSSSNGSSSTGSAAKSSDSSSSKSGSKTPTS